ncbi:hypothetical protein SLS58_011320 [Diplodia intermedia]|uniref:Uncharacterized protein n=1 Tax=Diplodia intermedia TaxID=856260 RepID=A0ABR3SZL5_9PEZI
MADNSANTATPASGSTAPAAPQAASSPSPTPTPANDASAPPASAPDAPRTTPAPAATPSDAPNGTTVHSATGPADEESGGRLARFRIEEDHWAWKFGLRLITLGCAIIGMSTLVWAGVQGGRASWSNNYYYSIGSWIGALSIPLICSIIFNIICVAIVCCNKRPVHPGVAVGIDLVLWLSLILTGFFGIWGYFDSGTTDPETFDDWYGSSSSSSSYRSSYYCGSEDYVYDSSDRTCTYDPQDCTGWSSCETKKAFYQAEYLARILLVGVIFTFICTVLHFITFVWACVDTNRRNKSKQSLTVKYAAERIVQEMVQSGQLVRPAPAMMAGGGGGYHPHGAPMMRGYPPQGQPMMRGGNPQGQTMDPTLPPIQEFYSPAPRAPPAAAKAPARAPAQGPSQDPA